MSFSDSAFFASSVLAGCSPSLGASPSVPASAPSAVSSAGFSGSLTIVGAATVAITKSLPVIVGDTFSGSLIAEIFILEPISKPSREEAMDAWELRIRMRELSLPESAAEELRRQQDLEGVRRRLTREQDALVREMRRRTATRPLSVVAVELERMDLQEQGLELMAAEPLEQPDLSDEEPAQSELLGALGGSPVAAQSEVESFKARILSEVRSATKSQKSNH